MRWISLSLNGLALMGMLAGAGPSQKQVAGAAETDQGSAVAQLGVPVKGSLDGEVEVVFEPVEARYFRLVAYSEASGRDREAGAAEIYLIAADGATRLSRDNWRVVDASNRSAESALPGANALDGDAKTAWHSPGQPPHYLDLDLGERSAVAGMRYIPAKGLAGHIHRFAIFVSEDGVQWGQPVIRGGLIPRAESALDEARGTPPPIEMTREDFATGELVNGPIAISVDERNRVFVAETYRYEGRGVIDNRGNPRRERDDLKINTLEEREATLKAWLADGELKLEFDQRADEFEPGDDFFTKFSEKVALLEDMDGDGRADRRTIFAEDFNELLAGAGAGVLALDGHVYYTCIPSLWKLTDRDGDGRADERLELSRGYGVRTGWFGHDLHGLTLGPDGRIYFSMADRGFHVETPEGKILHGPGTGGVFRCWPDGSQLELFARGLRNPQELAFDDYGNLFTGDNNCDAGDAARLVYVVEEGDSGWDMSVQSLADRGPWLREHMWELRRARRDAAQPAWIIPPVAHVNSGPSGFAAYPGTGLPVSYDGFFFLCDYRGGRGSIQAFTVEPRGAGFSWLGHHTFDDGPTVSDVTFGHDGRMYVSEWGPGWDLSPHARIYTLTHEPSRSHPVVREVESLFREGFADRDDEALAGLLGHRDRRVRLRAQYALADRAALTVLDQTLDNDAAPLAKLHALWAVGQIARTSPEARGILLGVAERGRSTELRAHAIRLCGEWQVKETGPAALQCVRTRETPRLTYHAAMALGRLAPEGAMEALLGLLDANDDADVYLRHAAVVGLTRLGQPDLLLEALKGTRSEAVRLGAVLVLRRFDDPRLGAFLKDPSPVVVTEAARAIYDRTILGAMPALAEALSGLSLTEDAFVRRALETNFRMGSTEAAETICQFVNRSEVPRDQRLLAMERLLQWDDPPDRDGVWGRWRPLSRPVAGLAKAAVRKHLPQWLQESDKEILALAQRLDQAFGQEKTPEQLAAFVEDPGRLESLRIEALLALEKKSDAVLPVFVKACQSALVAPAAPALRATSLRAWSRLKGEEAIPLVEQAISLAETAHERQSAMLTLEGQSGPATEQLVLAQLQRLEQGQLNPAVGLELLQVAEQSPSPRVREASAKYLAGGPEAVHDMTLAGGDAKKGQSIYETNLAAQCMRCHAIKGKGGDVGPALDGIAKRGSEFLLESIVDPQSDVAMGYGTQTVTLTNGDIFTGILMAESDDSITLQAEQGSRVIAKRELRERTKPISGMPPMGSLLKPKELRDLIAFLNTLE